ncbi:unnamed protein product [Acanthoscelides obtectus]|uniref:Uncharacterized protein n=1 Tax=Acanthoscelides obtectus TaxID=200917 RepID=A0A9P0LMX0_ACAOB|nr:unnamed protein product [Acanthoscelides obtectus]CAK1652433.1 General transcription factor II-I repeat domain-containing protein 2A [Acanthoscelides obtectus]
MKVAVKITNIVRVGNRALTHRNLRDFLAEVDATYGDLLLHTDVRWLSAGKCLQRFFALRKEIPIFLKNEVTPDTTELENQMADAQFLADLAFLTDMTSHLNELNLKLQGKQQNIANLFGHINGNSHDSDSDSKYDDDKCNNKNKCNNKSDDDDDDDDNDDKSTNKMVDSNSSSKSDDNSDDTDSNRRGCSEGDNNHHQVSSQRPTGLVHQWEDICK